MHPLAHTPIEPGVPEARRNLDNRVPPLHTALSPYEATARALDAIDTLGQRRFFPKHAEPAGNSDFDDDLVDELTLDGKTVDVHWHADNGDVVVIGFDWGGGVVLADYLADDVVRDWTREIEARRAA